MDVQDEGKKETGSPKGSGRSSPKLLEFCETDSGYNSTNTTPENELFDFSEFEQRLKDLEVVWTPGEDDKGVSTELPKPMELELEVAQVVQGSPIVFRINNADSIPFTDITVTVTTGSITTTVSPKLLRSSSDNSVVVGTLKTLEVGSTTMWVNVESKFVSKSPSVYFVSRDYMKLPTWPLVSFDMEILNEQTADTMTKRKPWGITVNKLTEQIYVTDREQHEVLVYTPNGDLVSRFGGMGKEAGKLFRPTGLAFDNKNQRIFVADKDNHRVEIFSPSGTPIGRIGGPRQFRYPWDVAVSPDGSLIVVSDSRNRRLQLFRSNGTLLRCFTTYDRQTFDYPRGVAFSATGEHIFVTDFNGMRLLRIDTVTMKNVEVWADSSILYRPSGVDVDPAGNVIVTSTRSNCLVVFSPEGQVIRAIGHAGNKKLDTPMDVSVLKDGFIAVLDLNGRVNIF